MKHPGRWNLGRSGVWQAGCGRGRGSGARGLMPALAMQAPLPSSHTSPPVPCDRGRGFIQPSRCGKNPPTQCGPV